MSGPRLRAFAAAVALLLCLAAIPAAHAQPATEICDGRFERFLKGFAIDVERGELHPFLRDDQAIATCRQQLNLANRDHALIDAFIQLHRAMPDDGGIRAFATLCAAGRKLACAYAAAKPFVSATELDANRRDGIARLKTLLDTGLPVVKFNAGRLMISGPEPEAGAALLKRAAAQGDYTATMFILDLDITDLDDPATGQLFVAGLRKAANQGHIYAMVRLANHSIEASGDYNNALALYRRAANADPRYFQEAVAEAQHKFGLMLRDGIATPKDAAQAERWFVRARALGYEDRYGLPKKYDRP